MIMAMTSHSANTQTLGSTSAVSQSASSADVSSSSEFDSVGASSSRAC